MAVDGATLKEAEFFDMDTGQPIKVILTVRDIIYFRLLERIANNIARLR